MSRIDKLLDMLKLNETDSFLQHALALEYIKYGEDMKARELFDSILERDPAYTGSYYHLGKLLERINETEKAVSVYKRGISECKKINDRHAMNELQGALDDLEN